MSDDDKDHFTKIRAEARLAALTGKLIDNPYRNSGHPAERIHWRQGYESAPKESNLADHVWVLRREYAELSTANALLVKALKEIAAVSVDGRATLHPAVAPRSITIAQDALDALDNIEVPAVVYPRDLRDPPSRDPSRPRPTPWDPRAPRAKPPPGRR